MIKQDISYPLTNAEFIRVISNSFADFLISGTSRSNAKLKPLHGAIAKDFSKRMGPGYEVLAQGYDKGVEGKIEGRYLDKRVDITIVDNERKKPAAGISVKFIMQNYSQNSNNYFENMLGETANIRCGGVPYFQILIILDKMPYYNKKGEVAKWETFSDYDCKRYHVLSKDNIELFMHTPNKTLIYVVHIPDNEKLDNQKAYMKYYGLLNAMVTESPCSYDRFEGSVILNDYEKFAKKLYHTILSQ